VGRANDLIIRGGTNIDPVVIERALLAHPGVTGANAVGRPDPCSGEAPVPSSPCGTAQPAPVGPFGIGSAGVSPNAPPLPQK
jgi:hypothetical protein